MINLPYLPADKANHAVYGAAVYAASRGLSILAGAPEHAQGVAIVTTVACAIGKEAMDRLLNLRQKRNNLIPTHGVEATDAAATMFGGMLAFAAGL